MHRLFTTALGQDLEFLTARARALGNAEANAHLSPLGLKARSYAVLSLACSGENPSQRELADFLTLDASQIVALVDGLEKQGLVAREQDPRDRRSNVITATPAGQGLHEKALEAIAQAESRSLSALSSAERDELRRLLTLIAFDASDESESPTDSLTATE
jgi:DNA-binding MarR family transcriptional regulator